LIRYIVRKYGLGWMSMLFLAMALSVAEEFLIQQTSAAPLVIRLKGETYARTLGLNYVYFLWALIYESVYAVLLPVALTELIFPTRKTDLWIRKSGVILFSILFLTGCTGAWFTWTQIARIKVIHLAPYTPPITLLGIAILVIISLVAIAFKFPALPRKGVTAPTYIPPSWLVFILGITWSILLFGVSVLAFGIAPKFPPIIAVIISLGLGIVPIILLKRWSENPQWKSMHRFSTIFGTILGYTLISFVGFIGALRADLYFKIIMDIAAIVLMILLGLKLKKVHPKDPLNPKQETLERTLSLDR